MLQPVDCVSDCFLLLWESFSEYDALRSVAIDHFQWAFSVDAILQKKYIHFHWVHILLLSHTVLFKVTGTAAHKPCHVVVVFVFMKLSPIQMSQNYQFLPGERRGEDEWSEALREGGNYCFVGKHTWQREMARWQVMQPLPSSHVTERLCCNTRLTSRYFPFSHTVKHFHYIYNCTRADAHLENVHWGFTSLIRSRGVKSCSVWSQCKNVPVGT